MRLTDRILFVAARVCVGLLLVQVTACDAATPEGVAYQQPGSALLQQAGQLFDSLFGGDSGPDIMSAARELGFRWEENDDATILLDTGKRGWGDYQFSRQPGADIVLQAPHRFHDRYTGTIARRLFRQQGFASIALNSVPRGTTVQGDTTSSADLSRLQKSFHTAYSRAFVRRYPQGQLVQLHGFSSGKRRSPEGRRADIILSTGSSEASAYLLELQRCLDSRGWQVLRYPQEVGELGATRNSVGGLLRSMGHSGFTHIEMNLDTRQQLIDDPGRLRAFAGCLLEARP